MNRVDGQIDACRRELFLLKEERKTLSRQVIANRQQTAEVRNELRKLQEMKKGGKA